MKLSIPLLATALLLGGQAVVLAETSKTLGQQLEEAIYVEQTLGELTKAKALYSRILEQNDENSTIAAEALMRLAQCEQKLGDKEVAEEHLQRLRSQYPDYVAKNPSVQRAFGISSFSTDLLQGVPWQAGETLSYLEYGNGESIGKYITQRKTREPADKNQVATWKTELVMFTPGIRHQEYWQVTSDEATNHLLEGRQQVVHHKGRRFFGDSDKIQIKDLDQGTEYSFPKKANQYDQGMLSDLLRRLPYTDNFQTTVSFLQGIEARLNVVAMNESTTVPAGKFDCVHVKVDFLANGAPALFAEAWVSNDANRYLVQFIQGDVIQKLANTQAQLDLSGQVIDDPKGFSVTLPPNWLYFHGDPKKPETKWTQLVPFNAHKATGEYFIYDRPDFDWDSLDLEAEVKVINDWDNSWLTSYKFLPDSISRFEFNGISALSFQAAIRFYDQPMIDYKVLLAHKPKMVIFVFRVRTEDFDNMKPVFDQIVRSIDY